MTPAQDGARRKRPLSLVVGMPGGNAYHQPDSPCKTVRDAQNVGKHLVKMSREEAERQGRDRCTSCFSAS